MEEIVMYPHSGSENHGCEAIVRSTCKILENYSDQKPILFSGGIGQDMRVGLDKICRLKSQSKPIKKASLGYLEAAVLYYILKNKEAFDALTFQDIFNEGENGLALSIGGDNYCYGTPEFIYLINKYLRKKKAKTVLWGCSVEPSAIDPVMKKDLASYDLIIARESITYEALRKINPNTKLYPDPAFALDTVKLALPDGFRENEMVGINVSPMIIGNEARQGVTLKNYLYLMKCILDETDMGIVLIPHVCWEHNDDRKPLLQLYEEYKNTGRVILLKEHNCMEQKGYIARCRFFVGARTHATIAAYSSCVPTLVVGYSVKAIGIARDLFGTDEKFVLPVQKLEKQEDLWKGFEWFLNNEQKIRDKLDHVMPEYCQRALEAGKEIKPFL